jgi:hypothetical protein
VSDEAASHFIEKWQRREPEMLLAEVFCPPADKLRFRAWGALVHELREALFELSDPRVASAKTAWWAEELAGLPQERQRHPLSAQFLGIQAPWNELARALAAFSHEAPRFADTSESIAALLPTAEAVIALESVLFNALPTSAATRSLARHWLLMRLPEGLRRDDQAGIPMHLLARHGLAATQLASAGVDRLLADWAGELSAAADGPLRGASLFRRSRHEFDRARLSRLAAGNGVGQPMPLATLWRAWRAARRR